MSPQERVRRALALTIFTHEVALAGIRARYPDETPRQHKTRLAARYIDEGRSPLARCDDERDATLSQR